IVASAVDGAAVIIGHLPDGLSPGGLGQPQVPAIERTPNVDGICQLRSVTNKPELERRQLPKAGAADSERMRTG
ncbi:MAG TPA: hypothetical protein VIX37_06460, partial [Candidatus Sulfotelmatobacter sp.]